MQNINELNEYCGIDDYDFHPGIFRENAVRLAGDTPAIIEAEKLSGTVDPSTVYSVVKDLAQGFDGIENIPVEAIAEHVMLERDSYDDEDNDSYDGEDGDYISGIIETRQNGMGMLPEMNRFITTVERKAKVSQTDPAALILDVLKSNPDFIKTIKGYVFNQGYVPSNNLVTLSAQLYHCINEQTNEKLNEYQADNFSFRSEKRRRKRQERKLNRIADRIARRKARKQGRLDVRAMGDEPEDVQEEIQADAAKEMSEMPLLQPDAEQGSTSVINSNESEVVNPSTEEVYAEVLAENFGGESDNFLPFLSGALNLGKDVIGDVGSGRNPITGDNIEQFRDLFRKKGKKKYKAPAGKDTIVGNTPKDLVNDATKKVMATIENQKKKDFLRENAPLLVVAVVGLIFVGTLISKK